MVIFLFEQTNDENKRRERMRKKRKKKRQSFGTGFPKKKTT